MTRTSISDFDGIYLQAVRTALTDDDAFATFKRLPGIRRTIENVSPWWGGDYRDIVLRQTPGLLEYLDKFRENDNVGDPEMSRYPEGTMSPTTWRYIKVASDLQMLFGDLNGWNVAEIGAGYGGQLKILCDIWNLLSYTIYDLEPVTSMAQKYLAHMSGEAGNKLKIGDFRRLRYHEGIRYDLVISNWALSECTREVQDSYIEHVLRRSMRGYITYNQISHLFGIDSYRKDEIAEVLGFPSRVMPEGLVVKGPVDREFFILYWHSQPFLD